ncbi:MAG: DcaP family trimeric outer membrane transporter [Bacteroidota bacterium]
MKRTLIIAYIMYAGLMLFGQDDSSIGIKFSGYIKNDFFVDSRQTICAREGHFLLWPAPEKLDVNGNDINSQSTYNMLAIQSRLSGKITGPDAFGAKTSGLLEGDFFAQANDNINLFRMRHAYVKLNWPHMEALAGYTWNPLFVTDCFPGTVSFNTGAPIQSFARNPQLRFTYTAGNLKILAAALSQIDYTTRGVDGPNCKYLRNSTTPDMHLQLHYGTKNPDSGSGFIAGGGVAYKSIVPRLESEIAPDEIYQVDELLHGITAIAFTKVTTGIVTIKAQARYGENISDVLAISGYGVKDIVDPVTGEQSYTPLKSMAYWGEIHTNGNPQIGVFAGIVTNTGTKEAMSDPGNAVYGLATDIHSLYRIAPRIVYNSGKVRLALEMEYTQASYGADYNEFYLPGQTIPVGNLRGLLAVYYFF